MILMLTKKTTKKELKKVAEDLDGYVKFVVDIERNVLAAGGELHSDEEKLLLGSGSSQSNLWGGGLDIETGEIDYNSMINIRPSQNNPSRDVLNVNIRKKMDKIVHDLLL